MNILFRKLLKLLTGRVTRNVLFWLLMVRVLLYNDTEHYKYPAADYYRFMPFTFLLLIAFTYLNNLWLVPRYLAQKKYAKYVPLLLAISLVAGMLFVFVLKIMKNRYPQMEIYHVSLITSPVGPRWSLTEILVETGWYAAGLLLWSLLMTMAWFANDYSRKAREAEVYKARQAEAELAFLKAQIHPHFIFNTLNNLYGLALRKSDDTPEAIMKLSSLMRYMLDDAGSQLVSAEKEIEVMRSYIDLELLRLSDHSRFRFLIETDRDYRMPSLLWLPVLENVFKHGTRIISEQLYIDYRFQIKDGVLRIYSRNFYRNGQADATGNRKPGIGIANLEKRLQLLYPGGHSLAITSEDSFYTVILEVTL